MVHPGRAWQHLASVWKPVAPFAGSKWVAPSEIREAKRENHTWNDGCVGGGTNMDGSEECRIKGSKCDGQGLREERQRYGNGENRKKKHKRGRIGDEYRRIFVH